MRVAHRGAFLKSSLVYVCEDSHVFVAAPKGLQSISPALPCNERSKATLGGVAKVPLPGTGCITGRKDKTLSGYASFGHIPSVGLLTQSNAGLIDFALSEQFRR